MAKTEYKLEVMEIPPRSASGVYDMIVADFIKEVLDNSKVTTKAAKVSIPNKRAKTAQIGLAKAVTTSGRKDLFVRMVNNELYLTNKR